MKITLTVQDGTPQTFDYVVEGSVSFGKQDGVSDAGGYFTGPGQPIDLLAAQVQKYITVGAGNGPCKTIIKVIPGDPKIVVANFGPVGNPAPMHASIGGHALAERGDGSAGGSITLGLNGAQGADVNLTTGEHALIIQNASAGDMGEKMVDFVIQL